MTKPQCGAMMPREAELGKVKAAGPLHALVVKSHDHLMKGPLGFGSDWSDPNEPGDGRGRWVMAMCNYAAYLHEKPTAMLREIERMRTVRNPRGFFGLDKPPEVIQAQASFDNSWPIQWGVDYTSHFGDPIGLELARSIADSFYVPRIPFYRPYADEPKGHWMGEHGHSGVGLGGMVGVARLALATGDERYRRAATSLADLLLETDYAGWHGHCTSTAVLGLLYTYQLTGDPRYLDGAARAVEVDFPKWETPYLGHGGGMRPGMDHSEGCGVSDRLHLALKLGAATGLSRLFDRAEMILWGPFFHHVRPSGGMGVDGLDGTRTRLKVHDFPWAYDADMCCSMWVANGVARVFTHAVLAEEDRLTLPLFYPFTASTRLGKAREVALSMETSYPNQGAVTIRILRCDEGAAWTLRLRVPGWSAIDSITVNGQPQDAVRVDGWLTLTRAWRTGDQLSFQLQLPVWLTRPDSYEPEVPPNDATDALVKDVRLFSGPLLLGISRSRNPHLPWRHDGRFTLGLHDGALAAVDPAATQRWDAAFLYPEAHRVAMVAKGPSESGSAAVLTPIAEAPGRMGDSPQEVRQAALDEREAVVFDVLVPGSVRTQRRSFIS